MPTLWFILLKHKSLPVYNYNKLLILRESDIFGSFWGAMESIDDAGVKKT